jgi:hypothetical protein
MILPAQRLLLLDELRRRASHAVVPLLSGTLNHSDRQPNVGKVRADSHHYPTPVAVSGQVRGASG